MSTSCNFSKEKYLDKNFILKFYEFLPLKKSVRAEGFKIIYLDTLNVRQSKKNLYTEVKYKNIYTHLEIERYDGKYIVVKNGEHIIKNEKDNTEKREFWDCGVLIRTQYFDKEKNLTAEDYTDFEKILLIMINFQKIG